MTSLASGLATASTRYLINKQILRGGAAIGASQVVSKMGGGASDNATTSNRFKLFLLVLMVIQNSSVVLIGRYTRSSGATDDLYIVSHFIIVTELMKLLLSALLEQIYYKPIWTAMNDHVLKKPLDCLKISVPAILYLVQNSLLYVALSNLAAPLFQVCYQAKLLTTALVSVVLLQRRYSLKQWICLTTLGMGVAVVVLGEKKAAEEQPTVGQNLFVGLVAVTISCFSSAFAGVYFEKVLKRPGTEPDPPSLWMRNVQLAFFSVLIAIGQFCYQQYQVEGDSSKPFMHGFTTWVWLLVLVQAGGGLLVAAIIKYADNVLKGLATGVAVVVSTICSMIVFHTPLTLQFSAGAFVILTSVFLFTNNISLPGAKKVTPPPTPEVTKPDIESSKTESEVETVPLNKS